MQHFQLLSNVKSCKYVFVLIIKMGLFWVLLGVIYWYSKVSIALIIEGNLVSAKEWEFLTRYCYNTKFGKVEFSFEYPLNYCCQKLIVYYDDQWPNVYPQKSLSCQKKVNLTNPSSFQVLTLSAADPESRCETLNNTIKCKGERRFTSTRARWWFFVITNCDSFTKLGVRIKYRMVMTNGETFWSKHFSADENNILQTDIFFLFFYQIIIGFSLAIAYVLQSQQYFHSTYKIYLWSILFECFSIIINISYFVDYGKYGLPKMLLKQFAFACHCIHDTIFVILLMLLSKGLTVTRGKISNKGQVKLSMFCTAYAITYLGLFIDVAKEFDPGEVMYIYESTAGVGICTLRAIAWLWFCYGIFFTLKNYKEKRFFYYPFTIFYSLWFLSGPVIVLVAYYVLEAYIRAQVVNCIDRLISTAASAFFLVITRPSAANRNFPFHVRTSQVSAISDSLNQNFQSRSYKPSTDDLELSSQEIQKEVDMFSIDKQPKTKAGISESTINSLIETDVMCYNHGSTETSDHKKQFTCSNNFVNNLGFLYNSPTEEGQHSTFDNGSVDFK